MQSTDEIEIERLGGLAGMGLGSSRIRSRACTTVSALSKSEQAALAHVLSHPAAPHPQTRDGFHYRITRRGADGTQTVEVPAAQLPASLQAKVTDELI